MIASPAIVTQIGEIADITLGKQAAPFHRRKYRAKPLAIPTSITDLHDPADLSGGGWV